MSRIFLSHSSLDDFEAIALHDWLASEGWDDVFLDLDPDRGIAAGQRWERRLFEAASRCEAVLFLVTSHWLASGWCLKEYATARRLNKKLFALLVEPGRTLKDLPEELTGTWQVTDLSGGQDMQLFRAVRPGSHEERHVGFDRDGLRRLKHGLQKAGLDARYFAWPPDHDPERAPFRGLKPLEAADAGIFFGRDAPIVEAVDKLRGLTIGAPPRLFVILGASGAGKSSFLRAGLLPRLARDDTHFVPLPSIRPERAAITGENGLLKALELACPDRTRAELRSAIQAGAPALRSILDALAQATFRRTLAETGTIKPPAIVLAIDQAEELFRVEASDEGQMLLGLLRELVAADDPAIIVIFAIRSDSYDALEHAKPLQGLRQEALPLLPMPRGAFKEVIEGPARRAVEAGGRLTIEPRLTQTLLEDIEQGGGSDVLPLLAFTLEQLFLEYHRSGILRADDYRKIGGLKGAIDAAVQRAFSRCDADHRVPRERNAREALLRRGLIPWLAGIDPDTRAPRRNIARRADIPAEAAPLIDLLAEERLLSIDTAPVRDPAIGVDTRVATIEPTHEALLRQWGLLESWLAEDFGLLVTLENLKRAARDWDANARGAAWLAHQSERLADARTLEGRPDIAARLDAIDRMYVLRCQEREEALRAEAEARRTEREAAQARSLADAQALAAARRRYVQVIGIGLIAAVVLAMAAVGFAYLSQREKSIAEQQTQEAKRQRDRAEQSVADFATPLMQAAINPQDMLGDLNQKIAQDPSNPINYFMRAVFLTYLGANDRALVDLDKTLALDDRFLPAYLGRGSYYGGRGDFKKALANFERAAQLDPDDGVVQNLMGWNLQQLGQNDRALEDYTHAIHLQPNSVVPLLNRGHLNFRLKRLDAALADYTATIQLKPQDPNVPIWYVWRGNTYLAKGLVDAALDDYNKAIGINPGYDEAYAQRAHLRFAQHAVDPAIVDMSKAISLYKAKGAPDIWLSTRGNWLKSKGNYAAALADYDAALSIAPNNEDYLAARASLYGETRQYDKALADIDKLIAAGPDLPKAARFHFARGLILANRNDERGAIAAFSHAVALAPAFAEAVSWRGLTYMKLHENDKALADSRNAVKLMPKSSVFQNNLGVASRVTADYPEALRSFDTAIALDAKNVRAVYNRGNLYRAIGNYDGARDAYASVAKIATTGAEVSSVACWIALVEKRFQAAKTACEQSLLARAADAYALDGLGFANLGLGESKDADDAFAAALLIEPKLAEAACGRAIAARRAGTGAVADNGGGCAALARELPWLHP